MDWLAKVDEQRKNGSLEGALAVLNEELAKRPSDPQVHYQLAWTHDALGKEADAALAYERAIELGLTGNDLEGAYLGLGSTYRCLGQYEKSLSTLNKAIELYP